MAKEFIANQVFDFTKMRHYTNDECSVFHCHHYSSLFTQLADDSKMFKGDKQLFDASEEVFYRVLRKYFKDNSISPAEDRKSIAEQYLCFIGLGKVEIKIKGDGGSAEMVHSHVDEGWIKKWSKRDQPVNYIGQGFLAAAFASITDKDVGSYSVEETQSIVSGATSSKFVIKKI